MTNSSDPQIFDMTLDLEALQTRAAGVAPSPKGDEPVCEASLEEKDMEQRCADESPSRDASDVPDERINVYDEEKPKLWTDFDEDQ